MWEFAIITVFLVLVLRIWKFLNWAWLKPKRTEKLFREQGMKGNSYKFLFGDSKETALLYEKAYSKTIGIHDDIVPRVMPNIHHIVQKYGNYSFTWMGPRPRIFIMDLDVAREVLNKYRKYLKPFKTANQTVKLFATGLGILEGDEWAKSRSSLNPAFSLDKLKPMVPAIYGCCEETINQWNEMISKDGGSSEIDVSHHLDFFTGAVLAQLMFSSPYTDQIQKTFQLLVELSVLARLPSKMINVPGEKYWPTKTNRRGNEIDRFVKASFKDIIHERLRRGAPSGDRDLLDIFLEELHDGKPKKKSERQKIIEDAIGQCRLFFFAGFDTSSNLLIYTLVTLAIHQEWQARAREEVFQVMSDRKEITSNDLSKFKIITMITNEMLRLYTPVMEVTRLVEEETKIKEYTIPKDSLLTFPIIMYHRDPTIWGKDANEFNPERFAEGVMKATNGVAAYMPFGWGPRICIGNNFSLLETKTFLAVLLRNFSFELSPTYTHAPVAAFTIRPQYGSPIVFKRL